jgi:exodeoxyribonuclease-5
MLPEHFIERTRKIFPFELTAEQNETLERLAVFLFRGKANSLFMLKGYAGTGKSSLIGAAVRVMGEMNKRAVLLAPTGKAAKVFALYAGRNAYTIHRKIYRQKKFSNEMTGFDLADNKHSDTLFIVDEASMISNGGSDKNFGSGRLFDDLIDYVYLGGSCRLLLLGDPAQLPPVGKDESPALDAERLRGFELDVTEVVMRQVVRQAEDSGILANATMLRRAMEAGETNVFPRLMVDSYPDVRVISGSDLTELMDECYRRDGVEETTVISRSNRQANAFNDRIRRHILSREEELSGGDLLLVVKNNYSLTGMLDKTDFIANGDILQVRHIGKSRELYGFRFCDIVAYFPDYDFEADLKIIMDTLYSESPALPEESSSKLFEAIWEKYSDVSRKSERMKKVKEDPYFNAVQLKFAYSVTCHKSQGGQWKNVFLDLSYVPESYLGLGFYRWLYTAFTRATGRIFLINPSKRLIHS